MPMSLLWLQIFRKAKSRSRPLYLQKQASRTDPFLAIWAKQKKYIELKIFSEQLNCFFRYFCRSTMLPRERAYRILGAWESGSSEHLKCELLEVFAKTRADVAAGSSTEDEEQQMLESVASDLWHCLARAQAGTNTRLQSNFTLLHHLSQRTPCAA
jgi:hypothetical protein